MAMGASPDAGVLAMARKTEGVLTLSGGDPDFDGNGTVGTSDLLELLGNWGPCPPP